MGVHTFFISNIFSMPSHLIETAEAMGEKTVLAGYLGACCSVVPIQQAVAKEHPTELFKSECAAINEIMISI